LFEKHLALIQTTVTSIARRRRLDPEAAQEFSSFAFLRLLENDARALRAFQGRSSLRTYLIAIVQRLYLDFHIQRYGKWRPSRQAIRLGPLAVELDRLLRRDFKTVGEAAALVRQRGLGEPTRDEVDAMARLLPGERRRARLESLEKFGDLPSDGGVEERLIARELRIAALRIGPALASALAGLSPEDGLLLRLRFLEGMTVRAIARRRSVAPRALYGRFERIFRDLRGMLARQGLGRSEVQPWLAGSGSSLIWAVP
jgi:RNA polymerase sigma factor (sigma-70 family)